MIRKDITVKNARVLVLGITFKENCPDIRNTKVVDVVKELEQFGCKVDIYDPWAVASEVKHEYGRDIVSSYSMNDYNAIVLAVAHNKFKTIDFGARSTNTVLYDIKSILPIEVVDGRL